MAESLDSTLGLLLAMCAIASLQATTTETACCLPQNFTTYARSIDRGITTKLTFDFAGERQMMQFPGSHNFVFLDLASNMTYMNISGKCWKRPMRFVTLTKQCYLEGETLYQDNVHVGEDLSTQVWGINNNKTEGFVLMSKEKCYPVVTSLTDRESGKSEDALYSDVKEEIDESVFPKARDLVNCTTLLTLNF